MYDHLGATKSRINRLKSQKFRDAGGCLGRYYRPS